MSYLKYFERIILKGDEEIKEYPRLLEKMKLEEFVLFDSYWGINMREKISYQNRLYLSKKNHVIKISKEYHNELTEKENYLKTPDQIYIDFISNQTPVKNIRKNLFAGYPPLILSR